MALTINLPEHIRTYIEKQVAEGRFESEEAVIANAVEHLMDEYRWEEDEELLDAIAEYERDGGAPWTPELRKQFIREAREGAERGEPVPHDLTY